MAAITATSSLFPRNRNTNPSTTTATHLYIPPPQQPLFTSPSKISSLTQSHTPLRHLSSPFCFSPKTDDFRLTATEIPVNYSPPLDKYRPVRFAFWVLIWACISLTFSAVVGDKAARAAALDSSIRASGFGLKFASALRRFRLPDEAVVFALATLPVVELRGAIPVDYWLQLSPLFLTVLAVLGNMVPVPFIVLYLKRVASFLARSSPSASRFLELLFEKAREKVGPVEEFQWLGLMLFVAVPFPGTGAWTGAIIASILDMPFWSAVSANFFGVVLAGLLVNLLVNLGLKYAILAGFFLFFISTFMCLPSEILRSPSNCRTDVISRIDDMHFFLT